MHYRFLLYITVFYFALGSTAFTQAQSFSNKSKVEFINTNMGLPSDEIHKIVQDSHGFIWIATTYGLVRYDGYQIKLYNTGNSRDNGLITNHIKDIIESQDHKLWLATDKGVGRFDFLTNSFKFYNQENTGSEYIIENNVNTLTLDKDGNVWIGWAGDGIDVLDPEKGHILHLDSSDPHSGLTYNWITNLFTDNDNNIWAGTWKGGLTLINRQKNIYKAWPVLPVNSKENLANYSPFSFYQDSNKDLWIGLWDDGLIKVEVNNEDSVIIKSHLKNNSSKSISGNIVFNITEDKEKRLWIATNYGLDYMNLNKADSYDVEHFMESNTYNSNNFNAIFSLLCDDAGLLWAGTMGKGIEKIDFNQKQFVPQTISNYDNYTSQAVHGFTQMPNGDILIGVLSRGFGKYNPKTKVFIPYQKLPEFDFIDEDINTVKCFEWDSLGNLWLGTRYKGLIKVNLKTREYYVINNENNELDFKSREINNLFTDSDGFIWVSTEFGLYKIVNYSNQFKGFNIIRYAYIEEDPASLRSNNISCVFQDNDNNIWVSTYDKGISKLVSSLKVHYPLSFEHYSHEASHKNHILSNNINSIFQDSGNNLYFCTSGNGLLYLDKKDQTIKPITSSYLVTYNILEDQNKNLWISSNNGLLKIMKQDSVFSVDHFSYENGLQGNNFINGAAFKDNDGNLYFGGYNGFNQFKPNSIVPDKYDPPLQITSLRVNQKNLVPADYLNKELVLNYNENTLNIEFSSLAFSNPFNNHYAYKFEGVDPDWNYVDANMRNATYANLKSGEYVLQIKGTNSMGKWSDHSINLNVRIKTAPYFRWWAWVIYFSIIAIIVFTIFYMFLQSQKFKEALKIEHIERAKSDKLNLFKQQLFTNISHEFLTPITILSSLIKKEIKEATPKEAGKFIMMQRNVDRLLQMVRQFLNYRKSEVGTLSLKVKKTDINNFINELCENYTILASDKKIDFTFNIDPDLVNECWIDEEKLSGILNNILSNAFKYTQEQGTVNLSLKSIKEQDIHYLEFIIRDSGKGIKPEILPYIFDRFFSIRSETSQFSGFGIGLSLTKAFIEAHKGTVQVTSEPGKGTQFKVLIPSDRNAFSETEIIDNNQKKLQGSQESSIIKVEKRSSLNLIQSIGNNTNRPKVLIVEDNKDFREILKDQLINYYQVIDAENGEEAYNIASKMNINIIVSDVLMPKMDGYELCKNIKSRNSTCHIPVILLTAKIKEEDRVKGYQVGADSFITKPFEIETLIFRIHSLLEQRQILLNKYTNSSNIQPEAIEITNEDEKFLNDIKRILEENISNSEFTVKDLCSKLSMSNSMLYRKVKSTLGISPIDFIRQFRLMRAVQLLDKKELTISEVAYKCGFSDVSYFSKCFKNQFGVIPSKYE